MAYNVGDIRPSQLLSSYGVGALIDLPHMSALVMGLDDWDTRTTEEIVEPRLLQAIQSVMGTQLKRLLAPPASDETYPGQQLNGVPVATFPRWMVCPFCRMLASIDSEIFTLKVDTFHPDKTSYRHHICSKANHPIVVPSRFMIACEAGHLDDFPWDHFVHGNRPCKASLNMIEVGVSGEPSDIYIRCHTCGLSRPMSDTFNSSEEERTYRPECTGRSPHLRKYAHKKCPQPARTILLSASNTWFPLVYRPLHPRRRRPFRSTY